MASNHVIQGRTKSNGWKLLSDGVTNNFLRIKEKPQRNELNQKVPINKQRLDDQSLFPQSQSRCLANTINVPEIITERSFWFKIITQGYVLLTFRESGSERRRRRERETSRWEKHRLVASHTGDWTWNLLVHGIMLWPTELLD